VRILGQTLDTAEIRIGLLASLVLGLPTGGFGGRRGLSHLLQCVSPLMHWRVASGGRVPAEMV
jgi:hypothetical protein